MSDHQIIKDSGSESNQPETNPNIKLAPKEWEFAMTLKGISKTFKVEEEKLDTLTGKLSKIFKRRPKRKIKALQDISIKVRKGECLGVIGRNGCGKTTLTKIMSGAFLPNKGGKIERVGTCMLMNLGVGMSHELSARQNIYVSGSALGLKIKEIDKIFDDIIQFAELEEYVDTKVKYFSTGMRSRLAFSIAVNAKADIMILDEVFAVGDTKFKQKAIKVFERSWLEGRTVIMVSHGLGNIQKYCDRVLYLKDGKKAFLGGPRKAVKTYMRDNKTQE